MPLMLTEVNNGRLSLSDYVRLSAYNPARIWGLYPRKGAIQLDADADLALVDLSREHVIADATLQSRSKISPWNGRRVMGLPLHTLVRGRFVMKDRALCDGVSGWGRSVHDIQRMPAPALRHSDQTMQAIVRRGTKHDPEKWVPVFGKDHASYQR
jgi:dihydroorotase